MYNTIIIASDSRKDILGIESLSNSLIGNGATSSYPPWKPGIFLDSPQNHPFRLNIFLSVLLNMMGSSPAGLPESASNQGIECDPSMSLWMDGNLFTISA